MSAYCLENRFPKLPQYYPLLDPGTYEISTNVKIKQNVVPFLAKSPRVCQQGNKIWTHAIHNPKTFYRIPNCSSISSKKPRFPYESLTKEELEEILCECDKKNKCECEQQIDEKEIINTESHFRPRIFIGPSPKAATDGGLSVPSKRDKGFDLMPDGSQKRLLDKVKKDSPAFLDTGVQDTGAFYHGCKWSHWTSKRSGPFMEDTPGPSTYTLTHEPSQSYICAEKIRQHRRKNSKQYRFIEMVQQKNIRENLPGPATYSPTYSKGTELQFLGPKSKRFSTPKYNVMPGPTDYILKREFDLPELPSKPCHAKLPEPSFFGVKAPRFKNIRNDGPGPASYDTNFKLCDVKHYSKAPFGTSSPRFKEIIEIDTNSEDDDDIAEIKPDNEEPNNKEPNNKECKNLYVSWMYKSRTERMEPLRKQLREPSPADLIFNKLVIKRPLQLQRTSPFCTSEPRFKPWYNWIPVQSKEQTPGPGRFYLEKYSCTPAVVQGPLYRSERFKSINPQAPPCTAYQMGGEIEKVLRTCNDRLKRNIENTDAFRWKPPATKRKLSNSEKEKLLISRSIAILNTDIFDQGKSLKTDKNKSQIKFVQKKKILRCFL